MNNQAPLGLGKPVTLETGNLSYCASVKKTREKEQQANHIIWRENSKF